MELPTEFWVQALIRRAELSGAFATIVRKGDARAGAVLVKTLNRRAGEVRLFAEAPATGGEGRAWMQPHPGADEAALDAYAGRQTGYDSDLWIVEIEDVGGRHFLTEPVEPPAPDAR